MRKNTIIYEPDYIIYNSKLLTSLCVYFDELILVSKKPLDEEEDQLLENKEIGYQKKIEYINSILRPLMAEQVITLYDSDTLSSIPFKSNDIELGDIDIRQESNKVFLDIKSLEDNAISNALVNLKYSKLKVSDLVRLINVYTLSNEYQIPVATTWNHTDNNAVNSEMLSNLLAVKVLCDLGLPLLNTTNPDDILDIRNELKNELIEFKAGILDLTYLLYQNIKTAPKKEINKEIEMLVNTKVKSSILSLEHKISTNKRKSFSKIVLDGSKIVISGALMALGFGKTFDNLNNGLRVLQSLSGVNSLNNREVDRIASYLIHLKKYQ